MQGPSKFTSKRPLWSKLYDFTLSGNSPAGRPWLRRSSWIEEYEAATEKGKTPTKARKMASKDLCRIDMLRDLRMSSSSDSEGGKEDNEVAF